MPAIKIQDSIGRQRIIWRGPNFKIKVGNSITYKWGELWTVVEILPPKKEALRNVKGRAYTWR